ncbi:Uncharacterized protein FWK35_00009348, partial [Aphis craccivora]
GGVSRGSVSWCGVRWGFVGWGRLLDDGVETVVVVSGVFDSAGGTVGFDQTVGSLDVTVSVSVFRLALDVVGVWVVYAVFEVVWSWGIVRFMSVCWFVSSGFVRRSRV